MKVNIYNPRLYIHVRVGLERCGKSCRLRWTNYLRPGIKRGNFSLQEEQTIIQLHAFLGNRYVIKSSIPKLCEKKTTFLNTLDLRPKIKLEQPP